MAFSKSLIFYLVIIIPLLVVVLPNQVVSQGDNTFFAYDLFSPNTQDLTFQGGAFVSSPNSPTLRLTKVNSYGLPQKRSIGRVVYSKPVNFWKEGLQASFETKIRFRINPTTNKPGDGITFFIVPFNSPIPPGSVDGNFGLFDPRTGNASSVFAVEFDAKSNTWDPEFPHFGIDINSRESKNYMRFTTVGRDVTAIINYVPSNRTITVFAANVVESHMRISYVCDLKTILPKQVQVGISSSTGSWVALHDLHSWQFSSTLVYDGNNQLDNDNCSCRCSTTTTTAFAST